MTNFRKFASIALLSVFYQSAWSAIENPFTFHENLRRFEDYGQVDVIDPQSGNLRVIHKDIILKGNGGLDIEVTRTYDLASTFAGPQYVNRRARTYSYRHVGMGWGWTIDVAPQVIFGEGFHGIGYDAKDEYDRVCTKDAWGGNSSANWFGYTLRHADGREESMVPAETGVVVTKSNWRMTCTGPGGLHILQSPDGKSYELGRKFYPVANNDLRFSTRMLFQATKATDKNGNWINFSYASLGPSSEFAYYKRNSLPQTISTSDGRSISFVYDTGTTTMSPHLVRIEGPNGAAWKYFYGSDPADKIEETQTYGLLTKVVRPDGTTWGYSYFPFDMPETYNSTDDPVTGAGNISLLGATSKLASIQTPAGGQISYEYQTSYGYRGFDDWGLCAENLSNGGDNCAPGVLQNLQVAKRSTSDGGVWTYTYTQGKSAGQPDITVIDGPSGRTTYKHIGPGYIMPAGYSLPPYAGGYGDPDNWLTLFSPPSATPVATGLWQLGLLLEMQCGDIYKEEYSWMPRKIGRDSTSVGAAGRIPIADDASYNLTCKPRKLHETAQLIRLHIPDTTRMGIHRRLLKPESTAVIALRTLLTT